MRDALPDTIYLLEHLPVVTVGRGTRDEGHVLTPDAELKARGIDLEHVDRGGDVTYHAPGQLVCYPILDLTNYGRDLHKYLRDLEQTVIALLAGLDVHAGVISGLTGVWVGDSKIAAIGIKVTRWVTMHGIALNINLDLTPMRKDIVPCGIADHDVTSLAEIGIDIGRGEVEDRFIAAFSERFHVGVRIHYRAYPEEYQRVAGIDDRAV